MLERPSPELPEQTSATVRSSLHTIEVGGNVSVNDRNSHHVGSRHDESASAPRYPVEAVDEVEEERRRHAAHMKVAQQQLHHHNVQPRQHRTGAVNASPVMITAPSPRNEPPPPPPALQPLHPPPPPPPPAVAPAPSARATPPYANGGRALVTPRPSAKSTLPSSLSAVSLMQLRPSPSTGSDPPHVYDPRSPTPPLRHPRRRPTLDASAITSPTPDTAATTTSAGASLREESANELTMLTDPLRFASPPISSCASTTWRTPVNGVVAAAHLRVDLSSLQREVRLGQPVAATELLPYDDTRPRPAEGTAPPTAGVPRSPEKRDAASARRTHLNGHASASAPPGSAVGTLSNTVLPVAAVTPRTTSSLTASGSGRSAVEQREAALEAGDAAGAGAAASSPSHAPAHTRVHPSGPRANARPRGARTTVSSPDSQPPPLTDVTHAPLSPWASPSEDTSISTTATTASASDRVRNGDTTTPMRSSSGGTARSHSRSGSAEANGEGAAAAVASPWRRAVAMLAAKAGLKPSLASGSSATGQSALTTSAGASAPPRGTPSFSTTMLSSNAPPPPPPVLLNGVGAAVVAGPLPTPSHPSSSTSALSASPSVHVAAAVGRGAMPPTPAMPRLAPVGEQDSLATDYQPLPPPSEPSTVHDASSPPPVQPHTMPPPPLNAALTAQGTKTAAYQAAAGVAQQQQHQRHHDRHHPPPTARAPMSLSSSLTLRGVLLLDVVPRQRSNEPSAMHLLSHGTSATATITTTAASPTATTTGASATGYSEGPHEASWAPPSSGQSTLQLLPGRYGDTVQSAQSSPTQRARIHPLPQHQLPAAVPSPTNARSRAHHSTRAAPAAADAAVVVRAIPAAAPLRASGSPANASAPLTRGADVTSVQADKVVGSTKLDAAPFDATPQLVPATSQEFFVRGAQRATGGASGREAPAAATLAAGAGRYPPASQVGAPLTATTAAVAVATRAAAPAAPRGAGVASSPVQEEKPALMRLPPALASATAAAAPSPLPPPSQQQHAHPDAAEAPAQAAVRRILLPASDAGGTLTTSFSVPEERPRHRRSARACAPRESAVELLSNSSSSIGPALFSPIAMELAGRQETWAWRDPASDEAASGSSVHVSLCSCGDAKGPTLEGAAASPPALSPAVAEAPVESVRVTAAAQADRTPRPVAEEALALLALSAATAEGAAGAAAVPGEAADLAPAQPAVAPVSDFAKLDEVQHSSAPTPTSDAAHPTPAGTHVQRPHDRPTCTAQLPPLPPPPPPPSSASPTQPAAPAATMHPTSCVPSAVTEEEKDIQGSGELVEASKSPAPAPPSPQQDPATAQAAAAVATASRRYPQQRDVLSARAAAPAGKVPLALPLYHITEAAHAYGGAARDAASGAPFPPPPAMPQPFTPISVQAIAASPYGRPATFNMRESRSVSRDSACVSASSPSPPRPPPPRSGQQQSARPVLPGAPAASGMADACHPTASSMSPPRPPPRRPLPAAEPAASPVVSPVQARGQQHHVTAATQTESAAGVCALPSAIPDASHYASPVASDLLGVLAEWTPTRPAAAPAAKGAEEDAVVDAKDRSRGRDAALAEAARREAASCADPPPSAALSATEALAQVPQRRSRLQMRGVRSASAAAQPANSSAWADVGRRGDGRAARVASAAPAVQRRPHGGETGAHASAVEALGHPAARPSPPRASAAAPREAAVAVEAEREKARAAPAGVAETGVLRRGVPTQRADALPMAAGGLLFSPHPAQLPRTAADAAARAESSRLPQGTRGDVQHDSRVPLLAPASPRLPPPLLPGSGTSGNAGALLERLEPIPVGRSPRPAPMWTAASPSQAAFPRGRGLQGAATHASPAPPALSPPQWPSGHSVEQPTAVSTPPAGPSPPLPPPCAGPKVLATPPPHPRLETVRDVLPGSHGSSIDRPSPDPSSPSSIASECLQRHQRQTGCRSGLPRALPSLALTPDPLPVAMRTPLLQGGAAAAAGRRPNSTEPPQGRVDVIAGVARRQVARRATASGWDAHQTQPRQPPLPWWPGQDKRGGGGGGAVAAPVRGLPAQKAQRGYGGGETHMNDFLTAAAAPACAALGDTPTCTPVHSATAAAPRSHQRQPGSDARPPPALAVPTSACPGAVAGQALHSRRETLTGTGSSGGSLPTGDVVVNYYGAYQRALHQQGPSPLPSPFPQVMTPLHTHIGADAPHRVSSGEEPDAATRAATPPARRPEAVGAALWQTPTAVGVESAYGLGAVPHAGPARAQRPPRLTRALLDRLQRAHGPVHATSAHAVAAGDALLYRPGGHAYAAVPEEDEGDWVDDEANVDDPCATPPRPVLSAPSRGQQQHARTAAAAPAAPPLRHARMNHLAMRQDTRGASPAAARPGDAALRHPRDPRDAVSPSPVPAAPVLLPAQQARRGLHWHGGAAPRAQPPPPPPAPSLPTLQHEQQQLREDVLHTRRVRHHLAGEPQRRPAPRTSGIVTHLANPGLPAVTLKPMGAPPPPPPSAPVLTATSSVPPVPQAGRWGSAPTPSAERRNSEGRGGSATVSEVHSAAEVGRRRGSSGRRISDFFRGFSGGRQQRGRRAWVAM